MSWFTDPNFDLPLILEWFSNDRKSVWQNFILWMNIFFVVHAGYWAGKATKTALLTVDKINMARVAALAGIYVGAYLILLLVDELSQADWSSVMFGVSLLVWYFVWAAPAKAIAKQNELVSKKVEEEIKQRLKENLQKPYLAEEEEKKKK